MKNSSIDLLLIVCISIVGFDICLLYAPNYGICARIEVSYHTITYHTIHFTKILILSQELPTPSKRLVF